jgi:hypothetical protein
MALEPAAHLLEVARRFVAAINAHDPQQLSALMTADHRFIDSLGNIVDGRETMEQGWAGYFGMVPDYQLTLHGSFVSAAEDAPEVVLTGTAQGSYCVGGALRPGSAWSTPVAVRARIVGSLVAEWRVYADNEPIREQMRAEIGAKEAVA